MSYNLECYLVEVSRLKSVIGSKDKAILDAVITNNPDEFDLDDEDDDDELTTLAALRQLIMGDPLDPDEASQYGYALIEICSYLGKRLDSDSWSGVRWSAVEQCGLESLLKNSGPPIRLPANTDFPCIGHILHGNILENLTAGQNRIETTKASDIHELLEDYLSWLETAAERGKDVVLFYY